LGGVFSYQWLIPYLTKDFNYPELASQQCSGLFEFEKDAAKTYKIKIWSGSNCIDFFRAARDGDLWVWHPATAALLGGYKKLKLKNPGFEQWLSAVKTAPQVESEDKTLIGNVGDFFYSGCQVPAIQRDITELLPVATAQAALPYFCGKPQVAADPESYFNDAPTPENCVWPQKLLYGEFEVEAVAGASSNADLDSLVEQSAAIREGCLRVITKYFIPAENAFIEAAIKNGLSTWPAGTVPAYYKGFQSRFESQGKAPYAEALFPAATSAVDANLKNVKWDLSAERLTLAAPTSQKFLRRAADAGAIVLFGNYPVFAMPPSVSPGTDASAPIPLPTTTSLTINFLRHEFYAKNIFCG
jgi:hypothetical protein